MDVFPEVEPYRHLLALTDGRARGIELLVSRSPSQRIAWTASYALAEAYDVVSGISIPRTLDQRHTVTVDLTWLYCRGWSDDLTAAARDEYRDGDADDSQTSACHHRSGDPLRGARWGIQRLTVAR